MITTLLLKISPHMLQRKKKLRIMSGYPDQIYVIGDHKGNVYEMTKLLKQVVVRGKASYIDYFIYFLPIEWMKDVLLGITSKNLEGIPVRWGKLLTYLGLWLLMSSFVTGVNTRAYWYNLDPIPFKVSPFIPHIFISFACFDAITKALYFIDHAPPLYRDKVWGV